MNTLILIGMMGSGKTSVGRQLAQMLNWTYMDTDQIIEERQGMSISNIFEKYGEPFFRELEHDLIASLDYQQNMILSTGGGIVLNDENVSTLRKHGTVVYLKASSDQLAVHIDSEDDTRPMLKSAGLEELLNQRAHLYESAAHWIVETHDLDIVEISEAILTKHSLFKYNK